MAINDTFYGSTLTDLQAAKTRAAGLDAEVEWRKRADFFNLAAKKADLESRKAEADKDRALRFYEVGQQKSLKERELDNEDKRLTAEAKRWTSQFDQRATENQLDRQNALDIAKTQWGSDRVDPRLAIEVERTRAARQEANGIAENAAKEGQRQIDATFSKLSKANKTFNWWGGEGAAFHEKAGRNKAAELIAQDELPKIRASLLAAFGEPASLVQFLPETDAEGNVKYRAVAKLLPEVSMPTRSALPPPTLGPPIPTLQPGSRPDESAIPWTLIGPDGKAHQFQSQEERNAALRAMQMQQSGPPMLQWNPQTGAFQ